MNKIEQWGFTVTNWIADGCDEVVGVVLTSDNGESQYLSMEEYASFIKTRDNESKK